jgi:hypothetical protein
MVTERSNEYTPTTGLKDGGATLAGRLSSETTAGWDVELAGVLLDAACSAGVVFGGVVVGVVVVPFVVWPGCWHPASQAPTRAAVTTISADLLNTRTV